MTISLGELSTRFGVQVHGEPSCLIHGVASLAEAGEGEISFLSDARYRKLLTSTQASAVILRGSFLADCPVNALVTENPYAVYARIAQLLHPPPPVVAGVHPTACIGKDCRISASAGVGPHAVIGDGACIGDDVLIGPGCVVEEGVVIEAGSRLEANVTICRGTRVGKRVHINPGAVVGGNGFGFAKDNEEWIKIPQLGGVLIGDDVEIGANSTIDRGTLSDTVIEQGVKLDNQVQIAHNVRIGANTAIAGCTGIAGSTTIGRRCAIGGGVGISGHLDIADDVQLTGTTFVSQSITEKGSYSSGTPFEQTPAWRKNFIRIRQLDDMARRLRELERRMKTMLKKNVKR